MALSYLPGSHKAVLIALAKHRWSQQEGNDTGQSRDKFRPRVSTQKRSALTGLFLFVHTWNGGSPPQVCIATSAGLGGLVQAILSLQGAIPDQSSQKLLLPWGPVPFHRFHPTGLQVPKVPKYEAPCLLQYPEQKEDPSSIPKKKYEYVVNVLQVTKIVTETYFLYKNK